jgi:5-methylthioadenosine/S-adenosylhomocysteine deaminase
MPKPVDLIISPRWLLPITPHDTVLEHHAVVVHQGKIIDVCAQSTLAEYYVASEEVVLGDHVLMPGLINLHTHAAMSLMRGLADDISLMPWLEQHIWPAEHQSVSSQFVYDGTLLACAEMLSGGVTTFNDMYFYPESTIQAATHIGMRAHIGLVVLEFSTNYAVDANRYIEKGTAVRDAYKAEPLVTFSFAPHAPYTVTDETFSRINMLAEQLDLGIHTHAQETSHEVSQSQLKYGLSPLKRFANLGLLNSRSVLAHCVHLSEADRQLLVDYGCHIAHCPTSNLKLASGIAPIAQYAAQGINIGLGTDGAASNNRLDMFAEMRLAALLAKGLSGDATVVSAHRALEMATINGARALGLEHAVGSIEVGKLADLTAIKMTDFGLQPCFDVASHLVYVAGREHVTHTWVAGQLKYHQPDVNAGVFSGVEPHDLLQISQTWQRKLAVFSNI